MLRFFPSLFVPVAIEVPLTDHFYRLGVAVAHGQEDTGQESPCASPAVSTGYIHGLRLLDPLCNR